MTQEEKQLLLKDLCGRLPYGVKVKYAIPTLLVSIRNDRKGIKVITESTYIEHVVYDIEDIKPYLRPMSSMTEKEKKERDFYCRYKPYDKNIGESYLTEYDMPDYLDWLLTHHFDYRDLIEKGLAIEAPEGMYKTK